MCELGSAEVSQLYALGFRKGDIKRLRSPGRSAPVSEAQFHKDLKGVVGYPCPNFDAVVANCARDGWQSMVELNGLKSHELYALGFREGDIDRLWSPGRDAPVSEKQFHKDLKGVVGHNRPNYGTVVANCARDGWQSIAQLRDAYCEAIDAPVEAAAERKRYNNDRSWSDGDDASDGEAAGAAAGSAFLKKLGFRAGDILRFTGSIKRE